MAEEFYARIGGHRCRSFSLFVPPLGPWFVEGELDEEHDLSGRLDLNLGDTALSGTVQPRSSGSFTLGTRLRVVASAGGWPTQVTPRHYHNETGVRAQTVAEDAARAAGETLGTFEPGATSLGKDYVRRIVEASRVLEDAAGGVPWWVDYEGTTHVTERDEVALGEDVELLEYDPITRMATLGLRDPSGIGIGSRIEDERLGADQVVRELEIVAVEGTLRAYAWTGGGARSEARIPGLLRKIARMANGDRLWGVYRYRVFQMNGDGRVQLQAVHLAPGLPDILPVEQWPGLPGMDVEMAGALEVLVQFIEGDPTQPVITGYRTDGDPTSLAFAHGTKPLARVGDAVQVFVTPGVPFAVTGLLGPPGAQQPFAGTLTPPPTLPGVIGSGSPKLKG